MHVLVMELVEGETLADRSHGPNATADALSIARQIAGALKRRRLRIINRPEAGEHQDLIEGVAKYRLRPC
jgi:hypothetical protein